MYSCGKDPSCFPAPPATPRAHAGLLAVALLGLLVGLLPVCTAPAAADDASSAPRPTAAGTFRNPLNTGPDPFVTHWKGNYYLTATQGDSVRMWRSRRWVPC